MKQYGHSLRTSKNSPNVVIIANCQGAALAEILQLFFGFEISLIARVHRPKSLDETLVSDAIRRSDFILTQRIDNTFPHSFVRSDALIAEQPGKILLWQNLYFKGYNPELMYMRLPHGGTYRGPLGDYHIQDIVNGYKEGRSVEHVVGLLANVEGNRERYAGALLATIKELKGREKETATPIADFIEENFTKRRLFYTFNHPSNQLLYRVAHLLANQLGIRPIERFRGNIVSERLNDILLPVNAGIRDRMAPTVSDWTFFTGLHYLLKDGQAILMKERRFYTPKDLIDHFYQTYRFLGWSQDGIGPPEDYAADNSGTF